MENEKSHIKGLSGWLILIGISLFGVAFNMISNIAYTIQFKLSLIILIFAILLFLANIYVIVLFFKKSKNFPKYFIAFLLFVLVWMVVLVLSVLSSSTTAVPGFDQIISFFIWTLIANSYMKKSIRVKNTFIE